MNEQSKTVFGIIGMFFGYLGIAIGTWFENPLIIFLSIAIFSVSTGILIFKSEDK